MRIKQSILVLCAGCLHISVTAASAPPALERRDVLSLREGRFHLDDRPFAEISFRWCYQSDDPKDQNSPQRFDITRECNPELVACIVEANQRLQKKLASSAPLPPGAGR